MKEKVIACDIGGTNMRVALVEHGKILEQKKFRTPKAKKRFLSLLMDSIHHFDSAQVRNIGIGIAGQVRKGKVLDTPNIGIKNLDLKKILQKRFSKPVFVANDADCFALAELYLGIKKKNFVMITLGTGIGGGLVINGKPYAGGTGSGMGVEFGHMLVNGKDWESLWKKNKRDAIKIFGPGTTFSDLCSVHKHHRHAKRILKDSADHLGQGIASLLSMFDPQAVVLGGGAKQAGPHFLSLMKQSVRKYSFNKKIPPITWTKVKHPGMLGASLLMS